MSRIIQRTAITLQHTLLRTIPCSNGSVILGTLRPPIPPNSRTYAVAPKKTAIATSKAKTSGTGGAAGGRIKEFPVESDTRKLQEYCCGSNILKEGEDIKLKPESEYPDWLFQLHIGPPKPLEELDPNSKEYWERVREMVIKQKNLEHKFRTKILKKF